MADGWETLEVTGTEEEATLICGYLESQGIPCQVESALSHEFPVNVSVLATVRVDVPTERFDEARRLLDERQQAPLPTDNEDRE